MRPPPKKFVYTKDLKPGLCGIAHIRYLLKLMHYPRTKGDLAPRQRKKAGQVPPLNLSDSTLTLLLFQLLFDQQL